MTSDLLKMVVRWSLTDAFAVRLTPGSVGETVDELETVQFESSEAQELLVLTKVVVLLRFLSESNQRRRVREALNTNPSTAAAPARPPLIVISLFLFIFFPFFSCTIKKDIIILVTTMGPSPKTLNPTTPTMQLCLCRTWNMIDFT